MNDIKDLTLKELEQILLSWGQESFHAQQIFSWIYKRKAKDFESMSDLSSDLRRHLKENFYLFDLKLARVFRSEDGTEKFLFELKDGNLIEAVTIPTEKRVTGCISTQVGCKFACRFCASGLLGFKRNLTSGEMIEEVLYLNPVRNTTALTGENKISNGVKNNSLSKKMTHLVFMGIGEPLDNYDNVIKAARIINSPQALNIGARRITISTCGIIPAIRRLAQEDLQIELSISLHAGNDKTRSLLMPINKKYPLRDLIQTSREYIRKTDRQITFEYVLIKGINSDLQNARILSKILKGLNLCKINLIPANPVRNTKAIEGEDKISNGANPIKDGNVEPPEKSEILLFRDYLLKSGINVTLRKPRGQDIDAACGQLRLHYEKR